ncbi:MAG: response regulator [Opitutaceae bacterium]|nr:response regulator [Opitutaceae bacterium]
MSSPETESFPAPTDEEAPTPVKKTLLVVDDEEGPRQSLRMVFRNDYNVETVESGEKAIEFASNNTVHVVTLDIRMAGISGIEVLKTLKSINPKIEIIMLTAYETLETARQAIRLGACDYLNKPFDIATIRDSVKRAMKLSSINDHIATTFDKFNSLTNELEDTALREEMAKTANEIYAGVLHDINNPLTIITGYVEMLEIQMSRASSISGVALEEARGKLGIISKQVSTCGAITSRYLKLLTTGDAKNKYISTNLILSDLVSLLQSHPSASKSKLVVNPLEKDLHAKINCTELIQILLNLCVNAYQSSSEEQTVEVTATSCTGPLDLNTLPAGATDVVVNKEGFENNGQILRLQVSDEGCGIPEEKISRIFEPYFTTRSAQGGTGLGLSIVSRLIKNCNGLLTLESTSGVGTRFTLYIPATVSK